MSYVREVLGEGEALRYEARFPWYLHAFAWGSLLLLGLVVIGILIFLSIMIRIWTTEMVVTSERVIYKRGWISRSTEELAIDSVEEVNLNQGFIGRIFNFGRIDIRGKGEGLISLPNIASPAAFIKALADAETRTSHHSHA